MQREGRTLQEITRSSFWKTEITTELWLLDDSHRSANEQLKFVCTPVTPGGPLTDDNGQGKKCVDYGRCKWDNNFNMSIRKHQSTVEKDQEQKNI
jgi:hypothetical protein